MTCEFDGAGEWLGGGVLSELNLFYFIFLKIDFSEKLFAVHLKNSTRQRFPLPANVPFADVCLPCATHGKHFAMGKMAFAECPWQNACLP